LRSATSGERAEQDHAKKRSNARQIASIHAQHPDYVIAIFSPLCHKKRGSMLML
jgi:hypothetical protein